MSTEDLQQIERAFLSSPRQPRRPLPTEFPPTPQSSSPHSRRSKRMLLSAMTPTQNSWRKKKRIREQKKNELIEGEAAARPILMLSSSLPSASSSSTSRHNTTTATFSAPHNTVINSASSVGSVSSPEGMMQRYSSLHLYKHIEQQHPSDDLFDAISNVANYEEKSRHIGQALQREIQLEQVHHPPPDIAIDNDHQHIHYNRSLPPPHLHSSPSYYKVPPPPMFGRQLSEDPFHSKPIIHENVSSSRHSRPPPSPLLSKK